VEYSKHRMQEMKDRLASSVAGPTRALQGRQRRQRAPSTLPPMPMPTPSLSRQPLPQRQCRMRQSSPPPTRCILALLLVYSFCFHAPLCVNGLSPPDSPRDVSRRDLFWKVPIGAGVTYGYGKLAYQAVSVSGITYPPAHETRIRSVIQKAVQASLDSRSSTTKPLRILEVGLGKDIRVIRRNLYQPAFDEALSRGVTSIEITGIDLLSPNAQALQDAQTILATEYNNKVTLQPTQASLTDDSSIFDKGYFDVVVCCITLCSVDDPIRAITHIKKWLRPNGGTLAFVEHVAVNPDEPYRFLAWQQQVLDPLQQRLVSNCHLHRFTQESIAQVFTTDDSRVLQEERYMVDGMWPVSCQACGVVQRMK
jgi:SAM-dependent methyltransferase